MKNLKYIFISLGFLIAPWIAQAVDVLPFTSKQLAPTPVNSYCLTTNGSINAWSASCGGGGGSFPFTANSNFNQTANSTTTQMFFLGSPYSLSASTTAAFNNIELYGTLSGPGTVSANVVLLSDTAANLSSIIPDLGQPTYETDTKYIRVGDAVLTNTNLPRINLWTQVSNGVPIRTKNLTDHVLISSNSTATTTNSRVEIIGGSSDDYAAYFSDSAGANFAAIGDSLSGNGFVAIGANNGIDMSCTNSATCSGGVFSGGLYGVNVIAGMHNYFSGNVGVGSTTPGAKLGVTGVGTGTGRAFQVANSSNVPKFTILDNGLVGIGTTSPYAPLSVVGQAVASYFTATSTSNASTFPYASTTALSASSLTSGNCVQASTGGLLTTTGSACGSSGASPDWNKQSNYNVLSLTPTTTIPVWFKDQVFASSSIIAAGNVTADTFTSTSTTVASTLPLASTTMISSTGNVYFGTATGKQFAFGTTTPLGDFHFVDNSTAKLILDGTNSSFISLLGQTANNNTSLFFDNRGVFSVESQAYGNRGGNVGSTAIATFDPSSGGRLGIGSSTPFARLGIKGAGTGTGNALMITDSSDVPRLTVTDQGIFTFAPNTTGNVFNLSSSGAAKTSATFANSGETMALKVSYAGGGGGFVEMGALSGSANVFGLSTFGSAYLLGTPNGGQLLIGNTNSTDIVFGANTTELIRIKGGTTLVGIGTSTPFVQLQVASTSVGSTKFFGQLALTDTGAAANKKHWNLLNQKGVFSISTTSDAFATSTKTSLEIDANGQVYLRNYADCNGTSSALGITSGQILCDSLVSDARLKKDFNPITNGLGVIVALKPISFYWKDLTNHNTSDPREQYGFTAQDVEKIIPSAVGQSPDGYKTLDKTAIIPYLVDAVQTLSEEWGKAKRSAEENWQWIVMSLLALAIVKQGYDIKKLKK